MNGSLNGWYRSDIYYNDENGYLIGRLQVLDSEDFSKEEIRNATNNGHITMVGYMPKLLKNEKYKITGQFVKNDRYGPQFKVMHFEREEPDDQEGIIDFLSSDLFKGIGKSIAKRIYTTLGKNYASKVLENPEVLDDIPGLTKNKATGLHKTLVENAGTEKILPFLQKHGFGNKLAMRIYKTFKMSTLEVLKENPYKLMDEVDGIAFKRTDQFALSMGFDVLHPYRIKAAIRYVIEELCFSEGHTYISKQQMMQKSLQFLENGQLRIETDVIEKNITELIEHKKLLIDQDRYYLPLFYKSEEKIAKKIAKLLHDCEDEEIDREKLDQIIQDIQEDEAINYSKKQKEAIVEALTSKVMILTGGPGTGKTTVVNGMIKAFCRYYEITEADRSENIGLVAPTGRAAKRLEESTKCEASTIHRFLGYNLSGSFQFDEENKYSRKLMIIDESSMIDTLLANNLLRAANDDVKFIFVGDENQLPSVGPGQFLKDLIDSSVITTIKLDRIHRQSKDSSIIQLAHDINESVVSRDLLEKKSDRSFVRCHNDQLINRLEFIFENALKKQFTNDDIQILAPMYKGIVGIDQINQNMQRMINPPEEGRNEVSSRGTIFRVGDKVLQLNNKPELNVMNGDIGYIAAILEKGEDDEDEKTIVIDFDGTEVRYGIGDLDNITLAYCISIHKSQGSEFNVVILTLSKSYSIMLRKKLIYTAVTRAKKYLILVGDERAYHMSIQNDHEMLRQTTLKEKLIAHLPNSNSFSQVVIDGYTFKINSSLENISPYDFMD
ncbi:SF1B family DNA helicase RecD2 [Haloplasma contractile]|uniref:ATP-dependent RecD2 DNA helicase n=1 Tax=Haloplasma contractile SSD-17B TaxID=1033810 RepID=U2FRW5_9MOLU|nr:ATP-dependent RecD-like DNA helicase [Haloplasma contractile]ERJ13709.1 Putative helicase protein [Haloplasma contractile SSD-17B]